MAAIAIGVGPMLHRQGESMYATRLWHSKCTYIATTICVQTSAHVRSLMLGLLRPGKYPTANVANLSGCST